MMGRWAEETKDVAAMAASRRRAALHLAALHHALSEELSPLFSDEQERLIAVCGEVLRRYPVLVGVLDQDETC